MAAEKEKAAPKDKEAGAMVAAADPPPLGCSKCRYLVNGCGTCKLKRAIFLQNQKEKGKKKEKKEKKEKIATKGKGAATIKKHKK